MTDKTHSPFDETYWVSCLRENFTSSSYGEKLETGRINQAPRQFFTRQGMFQRLESVLNSEISSLGHPRAALLAFGVAVLAYNVLAVLPQVVSAKHELQATTLDV